jgi:hypothetical protein
MAPTKRKRSTKHRGNAVGMIEARGRTGRRPNAEEQAKIDKDKARQARLTQPPTWQSAATRAGVASLMLLVLMLVGIGPKVGFVQAVVICGFAMLVYVPLGYWTDMALYRRRMRKMARLKAEGKA